MKDNQRILNVEVKYQEGRMIAGIEKFISPKQSAPEIEIPQLWEKFRMRSDEITNRVDTERSFGLFTYAPPFGPGQDFYYLAGVEINADGNTTIPDGMKLREIPPANFTIVTYQGPLREIDEAFGYYYGTWLPQSEYDAVHHYEYELYDQRYLGMENEKTVIELYFPVVQSR